MSNYPDHTHSETFAKKNLTSLSKREWDVLLLLTKDISSEEIAGLLCITKNSLKTYCTRIGEKLQLTGHNNLARFARKNAEELRRKYQEFYLLS